MAADTTAVMVDDSQCLLVALVDYTKADGAIGQVSITNRRPRPSRPLVAWGRYSGTLVYSPPIAAAGTTYVRSFRGNQARAGDVSEIGYN